MTASKDRVILHCDMNGFYASVELLEHPELKDKPMAVSGDPDNRHGIILAKNQLAKEYGRNHMAGEKEVPSASAGTSSHGQVPILLRSHQRHISTFYRYG